MSDDFHLSDEERARLERLKRDLSPSRTEADLIEMLRRRGPIRDPRSHWVTAAILATAVAAGLVATLFVYRQISDRNSVNQPEFVLLLYAGDEAGATPSRRDEYSAWARSIAAQGTTISSLELAEPSELIAVLPDNQARCRRRSLVVFSSCAPAISRKRNGLPPPARICGTAVKSFCGARCRDRVFGGV